jgi:hypothetical protein
VTLRPVALLASSLAWLAWPAQGAIARPLQVSVSPDHLTLGEDAKARVEVVGPEGLEALALSVSVGRLEAVEKVAPGRFRCEYHPPHRRIPQVAIVSAVGASSGELAIGWASLPLWGQGDAVIRTRPGAEVAVTIGASRFGPVRADATGKATIPVVVPPGVRYARQDRQMIDLGVPPSPRLHLWLEREAALGDRAQAVRLFAFAATPEGAPETAAARLTVGRGTLVPLPSPCPGVTAALWRLGPGAAGEVLASAVLEGDEVSRVQRGLRVAPGPPARLAIRPARSALVAGETDLEVEIDAADAAGNPVSPPPSLAASPGTASPPTLRANGRFTSKVSVPAHFAGARELALTAEAEGGLRARAGVALVPAAPASMRLEPPRVELVADGRSAASFQLRLEDSFGNPVAGDRAISSAAASAGTVVAQRAGGRIEYLAPRLREPQRASIEVRTAAFAARAEVELRPPIRALRLAPLAGALSDVRSFGAPYFGAQVAWRFALGPGALAAGAEAGYVHRSRTEEFPSASVSSVEAELHLLLVDAALGYVLPLGGRWELSGTAGAGGAQVFSAVSPAKQPSTHERAPVGNAFAGVSARRRIGPGGPFAEARVWHFTDPKLTRVKGSMTALSLAVGWSYEAL